MFNVLPVKERERSRLMPSTDRDEQKDFMLSIGFKMVETVYGHTYVMRVDENPPHLTNGESYWQMSENQAARMHDLITLKQKEANLHGVKWAAEQIMGGGDGTAEKIWAHAVEMLHIDAQESPDREEDNT